MVTRKIITTSPIAGVQAVCMRKRRKEFHSSAEICSWNWYKRQQRIHIESHRCARDLALFMLVLIDVVSFVFLKADIPSALGARLSRTIIHFYGTCFKIESTAFSDSMSYLHVQYQAGTPKDSKSLKKMGRVWGIVPKLWVSSVSTHLYKWIFSYSPH